MWDIFVRLIYRSKRALRPKRRLTLAQSYQVLELSEQIVECARMIEANAGSPIPGAIVEIRDLASRFRESTETISDALELLHRAGKAHAVNRYGYWRVFSQIRDPRADSNRGAA
jgi:hypothetical protein